MTPAPAPLPTAIVDGHVCAVGKRVYGKEPHELLSGEYCRCFGIWFARVPTGRHLANLSAHRITEHGDGSITVRPSIKTSDGRTEWHGFLEKGVWREVA